MVSYPKSYDPMNVPFVRICVRHVSSSSPVSTVPRSVYGGSGSLARSFPDIVGLPLFCHASSPLYQMWHYMGKCTRWNGRMPKLCTSSSEGDFRNFVTSIPRLFDDSIGSSAKVQGPDHCSVRRLTDLIKWGRGTIPRERQ